MSTSSMVPEPESAIDDPAPVAPGSQRVYDSIRYLLAKEYHGLATHHREPYLGIIPWTVIRYFKFILKIWVGVASSSFRMLTRRISLYSFYELDIVTILITIVLTLGVFFCVSAKVSFIRRAFERHMSIVNIIDHEMFGKLKQVEINAAKGALANSDIVQDKVFNLDMAKLLLLFASIMYERTSGIQLGAIKEAALRPLPSLPGSSTATVNQAQDESSRARLTGIKEVLESSSHFNGIRQFSNRMGIEFEVISELNSIGLAYSGLFWDSNSNWIVVAFKGTSPTEFDEWNTDVDMMRVPAGGYLSSYGKIHRGFKERIFPENGMTSRSPYETIVGGVDIVSRDLIDRLKRKGADSGINVYFTGHSLGCATATLAYAKMIDDTTLDPLVRIRDAYLFAAPVICDMQSVRAFNSSINSNNDRPKTMWRIVNRNDIVAVGLPSLGDKPTFEYSDSIFAFAHLGMELRMRRLRRMPNQSLVSNYYATTPRPHVTITSTLTKAIPSGERLSFWKD